MFLHLSLNDCGKLKLSRYFNNGKRNLSILTGPLIIERFQELGPRKKMVGMIDQDTWVSIRLLHARQGKSKRWIAQEFGLSRNTVAKYLKDPEAPSYRIVEARRRPVFNKWEEYVRIILADDQNAPRKQKHTANRVYQRLVNEYGYTGSARTVRYVVAEIKTSQVNQYFCHCNLKQAKMHKLILASHMLTFLV